MANQVKYLDQAGVAQLYKVIEDQLKTKLEQVDIQKIISMEIIEDNKDDNHIYLYGGSAKDLV